MKRLTASAFLPLALLGAALAWAPPAVAQLGSVTPETLDFGGVRLGDSALRNIRIQIDNDAFFAVFVSSTNSVFTPVPIAFSQFPTGTPFLADVIFSPLQIGLAEGEIIVVADAFDQSENVIRFEIGRVAVSGIGIGPFAVDPSELTFEPTPLGETSDAQIIRVTADPMNEISITVLVNSSNPSNFAATPLSLTLMPGASANVEVRFTPTQAVPVSGAILFSGNGANASVAVSGSGIAATVDPLNLILPTTLSGCSSQTELTVTPLGGMPVDVLAGSLSPIFSVTPPTFISEMPTMLSVLAPSVPPGLSESEIIVNIREGRLVAQQITVPVAVTGIDVVADPDSLNFGDVTVGTTSSPAIITVVAPPDAMLGVAASSDNPAFEVLSVLGAEVQVTFSPASPGAVNGIITLTVTSPLDPMCERILRVLVSGNGNDVGLELNPTSLDFGDVPVGGSTTLQASVVNASLNDFRGSILFSDPAFSSPLTTIDVPAGASTPFNVTFSPTLAGLTTGTGTVDLAAIGGSLGSQLILSLSGNGIEQLLSYTVVVGEQTTPVLPGESVRAPSAPVGGSATFRFVVTNPGQLPAAINSIGVTGDAFGPRNFPTVINTIEPGGTFAVDLTFSPTMVGPSTGLLRLDAAEFPLTGAGLLPGGAITGWPGGISASEQLALGVELSAAAAADLTGTFSLSYEPQQGLPADPMVMLSNGISEIGFSIPSGSSRAVFPGGGDTVGLQTGSVAGTFLVEARFNAGLEDVTPLGGVFESAPLAPAAPGITSVTIENATPTGFTVVVVGFSNSRDITAAQFTFAPRGNVDLQTTTVSPADLPEAFTAWFSSQTEFGGLFRLTQPFTVAGAPNSVATVAVTLTNAQGPSAPVSADLP